MTNKNIFVDEILENKKDDCKVIPAQKIKEEFFESYDATETGFISHEQAVDGCNEMISQDWSIKEEMFGDILMKEEIKEEDLEDESPLPDQEEERLDSKEGNSANATCEPVVQNCLEEKEMTEDILMKEEIKEEDLEDESPLPDQEEERLDSKEENSVNATSDPVVQNCLQEKIHCPPANVEIGFSPSNSQRPLFQGRGKLKKNSCSPGNHFKCSSCPYQTTHRPNFERHERTYIGEKPLMCSSCPYQAAQIGILKHHERTHAGKRPFKCNSCSYQATRLENLKRHERAHTGEKPFKCSSCPYQAAQLSTLKTHERTHTKEKPFMCSLCPYQATQLGTIKHHKRIHTGEKPFKCSSCSYQATRLGNLKRHQRTHTGERLFKCSFCPLQVARNYDLMRHERTHTGEKPFKCSFCPYQSARNYYLKIHERTHTSEEAFQI